MFSGSIVAIVTPFKKDLTIDEERLRFLVNWHIKNKTDAIVVCGTTGESATLSHEEHREVIKIVVEEVNSRIPVIAGAGSNCTKESIDLATYAKKIEADAALVITPYYNKPTQEGMYQHFKAIAKASALPIILYNVPGRTSINLLPKTVAKIYKDCSNVIGIKEASGSLDQITELMSLVDDKFLLLSGSDEVNLPILAMGGKGAISVIANVLPEETHDLVKSFLAGDLEKSRKLQLYLYEIIKALFIETNPIPVKTMLGLMGLIEPNLRLPLWQLSEANLKIVKDLLVKYKLIKK